MVPKYTQFVVCALAIALRFFVATYVVDKAYI